MALDVHNQHPLNHQTNSGLDSGSFFDAGHSPSFPPVTLNLFHTTALPNPNILPLEVKVQHTSALSSDCYNFFDQTKDMSRRNGRSTNAPKLDLKLNLSPPRPTGGRRLESPGRSATVSPTSPPSSCVSSELNNSNGNSPEATSSMVLAGCPRCLMYVMLSENEPKCPKCKSTVLLDFLRDNNNNNNNNAGTSTRKNRKT